MAGEQEYSTSLDKAFKEKAFFEVYTWRDGAEIDKGKGSATLECLITFAIIRQGVRGGIASFLSLLLNMLNRIAVRCYDTSHHRN